MRALGTIHVIEAYLYGVTPTDPLSFAVVAVVLLAASFMACWFPAVRAVKI